LSADRQQVPAAAVGEEAAETDPHEAARQSVEQEPPQELFGGDGHQPLFVLMRIILPSKSDFAVGKVHDPVIGNGDSVSVSGQVVEDMFGSSEWPFGIDYPALAEQWPKEGVERFPLGEHFDPARKLELSRIKGGFQSVGELAAKHLAQHFHRQEEIVARVNPALVIGRKATGRDHAMDMRMDLQILSPGVQNAEESDLCAHVLGIGGDLQQSGGAGAEQKVVIEGTEREIWTTFLRD